MTTESVAEMEIDRAHRLSKNNRKQGPRDIIFKPTKYKNKDRIIREARRLRPEGIYFKEDYTDRVKKICWQLRELLQDARKLEGVQAFFSYDKLLVLKDNARNVYGRFHKSGHNISILGARNRQLNSRNTNYSIFLMFLLFESLDTWQTPKSPS